jgi:poly(A) polymerase
VTPAVRQLLEHPDIRTMLAAFAEARAEARIVGGAVRDAVMGRQPGDIDIATTMLPKAVMTLARTQGWKAVPTGIEHGTITLVIDGRPYEVTTLRRDVATDGRHAVVSFTTEFREDAVRRDFTLNALSLSADGAVHDYATGIADAEAGIIRFMGDAEERIREDYLRILRFFRFHASHGRGDPDPEALRACAAHKAGLKQLSRERVRQELFRLMLAPGAVTAVDAMAGIGLWPHALPGIDVDTAAFERWVRLGDALPEGRTAISALAALVSPATDIDRLRTDLRLSRAETAWLTLARSSRSLVLDAVRRHAMLPEAIYRTGARDFAGILRAAASQASLADEAVANAMAKAAPLFADPPANPFRSADAAALGVAAGPRMGRVLAAAEADWIAAGLPRDMAIVNGMLRRAVDRSPH